MHLSLSVMEMQPINAHWDKVANLDVYQHRTKELAIVPTMDGVWIVLANKSHPEVVAEYGSFEDAFEEWSHA